MTQRTFQVEHPNAHQPSPAQVAAALRAALHADGLKRDGDYKIKSYSYRSGGPSTVTVDVPTVSGSDTDEDTDQDADDETTED